MKTGLLSILCVLMLSMNITQAQPTEDFYDTSKSCSPYFIVRSPLPGTEKFKLQSTDITAQIDGVIANVTVNQIYVNNGRQKLEAVYVFPGSTRAAVYGLDMKIGDRKISARVKEREQARKEYDAARKTGKRASLLEQHRPNVFQMNVANIMPGDTITVTMYYTELLEHRDGVYEFVYPGVVGPRYSTGNEDWVEQSIAQLTVKQPRFNIRTIVKAAVPVTDIRCSSHPVSISRPDPGTTVVSLANPQDEKTSQDYILQYSLRDRQVQSGLMYYDHGDEKFFMLMMQPPGKIMPEDIPPREYIFIVDVSGSMLGFPLEVSKEILRKLISSLRPADIFNVMLFESSNSMMSKRSLPATPENIENAIRLIDRRGGNGGTRLYPALEKAFAFETTPEYARTFIIATDGFVTVEEAAFQMVRNNRNKANLFALGIGSANRYLIEGLAYAGAGEAYFIENKTSAQAVGEKLIKVISTPVLSHIRINWEGFDVFDVEPLPVADLFAEKPIVLYGKFRGKPTGQISLTGITPSGKFVQSLPVNKAVKSDNEALRYLWARNRIRYLSDYAGYFGEKGADHSKQITEMGLKYNLLTDCTSFLAVDDQEIEMVVESEMVVNVPNITSPIYSTAEEEEEIFSIVEEMPLFNGGVPEKTFAKWIAENIRLPEEFVSSRVLVEFIVDEQGNVVNVKVIRGADPVLDAEAVRVVSSSPRWKPGTQRGKKVKVKYVFPIVFKSTAN